MVDDSVVRTGTDDYDAAHVGLHRSALMRRLWAQAMGEQYPAEVEPFSSCSWWTLGEAVAALRLAPDGLLVDLGCGRGGPGLWLARAFAVRLIGIDFSGAAIALAHSRSADFLPPGRAEFREATLVRTGLPDGCADGVVSIDAVSFSGDRRATLREIRRILAPGGRAVVTASERPAGTKDWPTMARNAGLVFERAIVNPYHDDHWRRLYASWLAHESELRSEIGDRATGNLLREAVEAEPRLGRHKPLLMVMRSPAALPV